jgi:hypothetical protein
MQFLSFLRHKKFALACTLGLMTTVGIASGNYFNWSSSTTPVNADKSDYFGSNVSGLFYQGASGGNAAVLWAVKNDRATLYKLVWDGKNYVNSTQNGWNQGKTLHYSNGSGNPDSEGVTMAEANSGAVYVAAERDGDHETTNRFSVLRYDTQTSTTSLNATHEWDLTAAFAGLNIQINRGLEAISWVPDSYLTSRHFYDEHSRTSYNPANYPQHGTGLFFVGMEQTGMIYAFALNHQDASYTLVATIASGEAAVMDLSFDRDNLALWAHCDNTCDNHDHLLSIDTVVGSSTYGKFIVRKAYNRPKGLSNYNFEGIAIAPEAECSNGKKKFIWANDSNDGGHVLWQGSLACGPLF